MTIRWIAAAAAAVVAALTVFAVVSDDAVAQSDSEEYTYDLGLLADEPDTNSNAARVDWWPVGAEEISFTFHLNTAALLRVTPIVRFAEYTGDAAILDVIKENYSVSIQDGSTSQVWRKDSTDSTTGVFYFPEINLSATPASSPHKLTISAEIEVTEPRTHSFDLRISLLEPENTRTGLREGTGRIAARQLDDGRIEVAWVWESDIKLTRNGRETTEEVVDNRIVRPQIRHLPANPPTGNWLDTSDVIYETYLFLPTAHGDIDYRWYDTFLHSVGRINVRVDADTGRVEFAFTPTNGPTNGGRILPRLRYFPATAEVNRWLRSSPIDVAFWGIAEKDETRSGTAGAGFQPPRPQ